MDFVEKLGSDVVYDLVIGFETLPPLTLSHFFNFVSLLINVFLSHISNIYLLVSSLNILFY